LKVNPFILLSFVSMFCICTSLSGQEIAASEWKFESQRKEIAPEWHVDSNMTYKGQPTLLITGGGKDYANGHWYTVTTVEPGEYFQFESNFITSNVEELNRNILARIIWRDASGKNVGYPEYPITFPNRTNDGWNYMKQLYRVPMAQREPK
jgi:hypothetical protein